jgi:hypothetical protein
LPSSRRPSQASKALSSLEGSARSTKASPNRWSHKLRPLRSTQAPELAEDGDRSDPLGGNHRDVCGLPVVLPERVLRGGRLRGKVEPRDVCRGGEDDGHGRSDGRAGESGSPTGARDSDVEVKRSHPERVTRAEVEAEIEEDGRGEDLRATFQSTSLLTFPRSSRAAASIGKATNAATRRRTTPQRTQSIAEAPKRRPKLAGTSPLGTVRPALGDGETDTVEGALRCFSSPACAGEAVREQRHSVVIVCPQPPFRKPA